MEATALPSRSRGRDSLKALPIEIQVKIFDELCGEGFRLSCFTKDKKCEENHLCLESRRHFYALCLVSKEIQPLATRYLYETVVLGNTTRLVQLFRTLATRPNLRNFVRIFVWNGGFVIKEDGFDYHNQYKTKRVAAERIITEFWAKTDWPTTSHDKELAKMLQADKEKQRATRRVNQGYITDEEKPARWNRRSSSTSWEIRDRSPRPKFSDTGDSRTATSLIPPSYFGDGDGDGDGNDDGAQLYAEAWTPSEQSNESEEGSAEEDYPVLNLRGGGASSLKDIDTDNSNSDSADESNDDNSAEGDNLDESKGDGGNKSEKDSADDSETGLAADPYDHGHAQWDNDSDFQYEDHREYGYENAGDDYGDLYGDHGGYDDEHASDDYEDHGDYRYDDANDDESDEYNIFRDAGNPEKREKFEKKQEMLRLKEAQRWPNLEETLPRWRALRGVLAMIPRVKVLIMRASQIGIHRGLWQRVSPGTANTYPEIEMFNHVMKNHHEEHLYPDLETVVLHHHNFDVPLLLKRAPALRRMQVQRIVKQEYSSSLVSLLTAGDILGVSDYLAAYPNLEYLETQNTYWRVPVDIPDLESSFKYVGKSLRTLRLTEVADIDSACEARFPLIRLLKNFTSLQHLETSFNILLAVKKGLELAAPNANMLALELATHLPPSLQTLSLVDYWGYENDIEWFPGVSDKVKPAEFLNRVLTKLLEACPEALPNLRAVQIRPHPNDHRRRNRDPWNARWGTPPGPEEENFLKFEDLFAKTLEVEFASIGVKFVSECTLDDMIIAEQW